MGHFVRMTIVYDVDHLGKQYTSVAFCEVSLLLQSREQLSSIAKVKHKEKILAVLKGLVDFIDLWVVEGCEYGKFAEDAGWVFDKFLFNSFDCSYGVGIAFHFCFVDG